MLDLYGIDHIYRCNRPMLLQFERLRITCVCVFIRETMLRNGLLVLSTSNVHCGGTMLSGIIESCVKTVCNLLYVHLVNCDISLATDSSAKPASFGSVLCTQSVRHFISSFYTKASAVQQSLEIRFLLSNICSSLAQSPVPSQQRLQHGYEVVLTDLGHELHQAVTKYVATRFPVGHDVKVIQVPVGSNICQPNFSPSWLVRTHFLFTDVISFQRK